MRIDLIRHGPTETPGRLLGRTDAAPSPDAWPQLARQTAGREWSTLVASTLARARAPAETLAKERGLELRIDHDWRELDFGHWDGQTVETLRADAAIAAHLDALYASTDAPRPPNGESWHVLEQRIRRALATLMDTAHESALVVTHGGPMRAALATTCGLPFASTWAFRIGYGTRITLNVERADDGTLWGEILEIAQP